MFFFFSKNIIYIRCYIFSWIHVEVFAQAVRHGDIYARSEMRNNNNVLKNKTVLTNDCEAEHICVWAFTQYYSVFIDHMRGWNW